MLKVSFSNILWGPVDNRPYFNLLKDLGCSGVELAPSVFWKEPTQASDIEKRSLRENLEDAGLELVGFHALLFTRKDLDMFSLDPVVVDETAKYLIEMGRLCAELGGKTLAFGGRRDVKDRSREEAFVHAVSFYRSVAKGLEGTGVCLCIEPLGRSITAFMNTIMDGYELVQAVDHPNLMLMADAKSMAENEEDPKDLMKVQKYLRHYHINDMNNTPPGSCGVDHLRYGEVLRDMSYSHYISAEVSCLEGDVAGGIKDIYKYINRSYVELKV